ncbi:hypothetical protein DFP72DRAFT_472311 [Ephemerocybe angulata]|uniref:Uncharacterized protein n=1 Tax=Ephemerocybe angulata TaxID=980116 RepID=A0A8H6HSQ9_9AGAR|nr:hypothetical protein DFP72DRAFT_472311 [Tulosesus angulatus]
MTVFSKVVTGLKHRIPASDAASTTSSSSSSSSQLDVIVTPRARTKDVANSRPVAPDLRRFSDFMNPFPEVAPGGYTKYYQARAAAATDPTGSGSRPSQYALPSLCELNQRPPLGSSANRARPPPIQTTGLRTSGSGSRSARKHQQKKAAAVGPVQPLASIPEAAAEQASHRARASANQSHGLGGNSPQASLRRRKGRLLRTPSVERDFASVAHTSISGVASTPRREREGSEASGVTTLGRAGSTSSSQSSASHRSSPSSSSSTDSHSDGLLTPDDSLELSHAPSAFVYGEEVYQPRPKRVTLDKGKGLGFGMGGGMGLAGLGVGLGDWEPFERPDSRSTYRTARTHFDDI